MPPDLDAVTTLEENLGAGWEHPTEVVIDAPVADLAWLNRAMGRLEAVDATTTRLRGSTSNPRGYAQDLARLTVPFRVVGGPELREAVEALSRRLADATRSTPAG
jgi:hypothetical protein